MEKSKRRGCLGLPFALWLPALYIAFAIYAWIDFTRINRDGLANVGLFLVTLPVTIVDLIIAGMMGRSSVLMPRGHGYLADHALYYGPAVIVTAALMWLIGRSIDRIVARMDLGDAGSTE